MLILPGLRRARPPPPRESILHRSFVLASVALLSSWAAACGDGATEPAPAPNQAPVPSGAIPAQTIAVGETATVNVASYFSDPDGDALIYTAASSNAATASVSVSGSVVAATAAARGVATITVTAQDPGGLSAQSTFTVTVPNREPLAVDTVPAQAIFVGETAAVDVAGYFTDPDGDALTYSATSADSTAVSASVAGSVVSVTALAQGMFTVTVTARDADGLSAEQSIAVTVPNRAPEAVGTIPSQTLFAGQSFRLDISAYFDDPDEDALAYSAASADSGVAAVNVAGDTVTIVGIEPGKLADLRVLNSNPLDDLRNRTDIEYVMKKGRLYEAATRNSPRKQGGTPCAYPSNTAPPETTSPKPSVWRPLSGSDSTASTSR